MNFETKAAKVDAGKIGYQVGGEGTPILYLHGAGGLVKNAVHESLATAHRVYLPTLPGFDGGDFLDGVDSMPALADSLAEFIKSEIDGPCDLVGHSFGGWLAAYVALRHPELVEMLVLECPAGFRPDDKGGLSDDPKELLRTLYAYPDKRPADDRPEDVVRQNRQQVRHYHDGIPLDEDLVGQLGEINARTMILYGTREEVIPIETCRILKDGLKDSYLIYIYDAAHFLEVDQPERVAGLILDFLARGESFIVNPGIEAA